MNLKQWLYDKRVYFIIQFATTSMVLIFMHVFQMNRESRLFVGGIIVSGHFFYLVYEYLRRYQFYERIEKISLDLDKKYLLHELIEEPYFYEGNFLYNILYDGNKSMNDEIQKYRLQQKDYADYIETWVHEIKTPLAASALIIENNPSGTNKSIGEELRRVESYVEQALYYAKSNHLEKDYIIKDLDLEKIIQLSLKKHSKMLIAKKCMIDIDGLNARVKSDEKWLLFILDQLINNAVQYSRETMKLKISQSLAGNKVTLIIEDSGIGIPKEDLDRVFDKGFTGSNGRGRKSTGIGLYLCRKLANKMGLKLELDSIENQYTRVKIHFPVSKMY